MITQITTKRNRNSKGCIRSFAQAAACCCRFASSMSRWMRSSISRRASPDEIGTPDPKPEPQKSSLEKCKSN